MAGGGRRLGCALGRRAGGCIVAPCLQTEGKVGPVVPSRRCYRRRSNSAEAVRPQKGKRRRLLAKGEVRSRVRIVCTRRNRR